jgi:integrase
VAINSRRPSRKARKRPPKPGQDRRVAEMTIEAPSFEQITTAQISEFISARVRSRGLSPKTANHYRQILTRLFNRATTEGGLKLPGDHNPAAQVRRYREHASEIRFLTLPQINEQLAALREFPQLHAMVAMYIYAGLRREEALWLQVEDIQLRAGHNGMVRIRAKTLGDDHWQPKTKTNRAVPVSRSLRAILTGYHPKPSSGGWYFPSPKGTRYDPDNFSRDLRAAQDAAGLRWTCLHFRHTFGSHLAQKGQSLYKISTLMGNSPEICRRHYAALMPETMADAVEFGQSTPPVHSDTA